MNQKPEHLQTGTWGEELAVAYLQEQGYTILERDWHSEHRDIDIIAWKDEELVFVEVKARRNSDFIDPVQAVDYRKRKNLRMAINHYVKFRRYDGNWRFDIITIKGAIGGGNPKIEHFEDIPLM